MRSINIPDGPRLFERDLPNLHSSEELWVYKVVGCSRIDKNLSFGLRVR
jgi:hypothetical protein